MMAEAGNRTFIDNNETKGKRWNKIEMSALEAHLTYEALGAFRDRMEKAASALNREQDWDRAASRRMDAKDCNALRARIKATLPMEYK